MRSSRATSRPDCVAYDPGFAYELALIVQHGLQRRLGAPGQPPHDVFFYITVMNQNHAQPSMSPGVQAGPVRAADAGHRGAAHDVVHADRQRRHPARGDRGRALPREFFEASPPHIVPRALQALADDGALDAEVPTVARRRYGIEPGPHPWLG